MSKFRKKPVVIEAEQFTYEKRDSVYYWCKENNQSVYAGWETQPTGPDKPQLVIPTLEGEMRASIGDWIIKGVKGEFYPCKPDIFEMTYEPVD